MNAHLLGGLRSLFARSQVLMLLEQPRAATDSFSCKWNDKVSIHTGQIAQITGEWLTGLENHWTGNSGLWTGILDWTGEMALEKLDWTTGTGMQKGSFA